MNGKKIIAIICVLLVACGALYGLRSLENYEKVYYTQIDNTKVKELTTSDEMKYEYTLDCYSESGKKKELKFKTSRELREDAYLLLEVRSLGVHKWEEVQYNELPPKVQEKIK